MANHPEGHSPRFWRKHPEAAAAAAAQQNQVRQLKAALSAVKPDRLNEIFGPLGFAFTVASWAWTVLAPDSSTWFASALFLVAVLAICATIFRIVKSNFFRLSLFVVVLSLFVVFDWYVVIKPQKGKQFKALLTEGYHITSECETVPGASQMPDWMRDQSKEWQAKVEQLISEKLDSNDLQLWNGAVVIGLVKDENMNAYQCLWLGNKIGALETIIATHYDPKLQHRNYNGPIYWFNAVNGHVDISDAFKKGNPQANVYINSSSEPPPKN